ncbi:MAG: hypothetical protein N4A72_08055 [Bacteroidales bacterium]|jgi:hypothetical protein|nr:hypothetical protein [Bacteroidales bacterium]
MRKFIVILTTLFTVAILSSSAASVSGTIFGCKGKTYTYSLSGSYNCLLKWEVYGATIVSGQATSSIQVKFYSTGSATIKVYDCYGLIATKYVNVGSAPEITHIAQVMDFSSGNTLTFEADIDSDMNWSAYWNCGANSIVNQDDNINAGVSKVKIDIQKREPVRCTVSNICGTDTRELHKHGYIMNF